MNCCASKEFGMDAFKQELARRSPLAAAVLESFDHVFDDEFLNTIWHEHRGRCYQDVLTFGQVTGLMRDALIRHQGSAHKLFIELETDSAHPANESSFYRKLANMPVAISRAMLREATAKLTPLIPGPALTAPACFDGFELIVGDGKKIKNAAKRLAPARGFCGSLLGAAALVGLNLRSGMAVAMSDSLDGMTNDVPMVPALMSQLRQLYAGPILTIYDRQFGNARTINELCARPGDAFVARVTEDARKISVESSAQHIDESGRRVTDQIIVMGVGKKALALRHVRLERGDGDEDVVLLSSLMDGAAYPADDLLRLYKMRWGIEQVFQQVTETFSLTHLIGGSPKAVLFQFSFCLLLYNQMQVVKSHVAAGGGVEVKAVSMYYLFDDVRKELEAWAYHTDGRWPRTVRTPDQMRARLVDLLRGVWHPIRYGKQADKKPRGKPKPKVLLHGGYSSMQRVLEGRVKVKT